MLDWHHIISTMTCDYPGCTTQATTMQPGNETPEGYIHYWCAEHDPRAIKPPSQAPTPPAVPLPVKPTFLPLTPAQVAQLPPDQQIKYLDALTWKQLREQGEDWH